MEDTIVVKVKPEHFRDAPDGYSVMGFSDGNSIPIRTPCVLEVALIERFGKENVAYVGGFVAMVGDNHYKISPDWGGGREGDLSISDINRLSDKAKKSLKGIPTIEVTLTKRKAVSMNYLEEVRGLDIY